MPQFAIKEKVRQLDLPPNEALEVPDLLLNELQAWWRGKTYVVETLKCLPEMPEAIFIEHIVAQVAELGRINHVEATA